MVTDVLFGVAAIAILLVQIVLLVRHARSPRAVLVITLAAALALAALVVGYAHWLGPVLHPAPSESEAPR